MYTLSTTEFCYKFAHQFVTINMKRDIQHDREVLMRAVVRSSALSNIGSLFA